jgi:hypothetical protein
MDKYATLNIYRDGHTDTDARKPQKLVLRFAQELVNISFILLERTHLSQKK